MSSRLVIVVLIWLLAGAPAALSPNAAARTPMRAQAALPPGAAKLVAVMPFRYANNRIMLTLSLNDQQKPLQFLFDTGADGVAIKKSVADEAGIFAVRQEAASAVGGVVDVGIADSVTLRTGKMKIPGNVAAILPYLDESLDGIVGGNFLKNYITEIDFDRSEIRLYTFGTFRYTPQQVFIPLDFSRGIPGIPCQVTLNNGKVLRGDFHFDTGAGYPLIIFGPSVHDHALSDSFRVDFKSGNTSLGYRSITLNGKFNAATLGPWTLPPFTGSLQVYREGDERWSPGGDGSLGIELIRKFNWVINLEEHRFAASPNRNFHLPASLWVNNVEWQFVGKSMQVKRTMPGSHAAAALAPGDTVVSINGVDAHKLLDQRTMQQYATAWKGLQMTVKLTRQGRACTVQVP